MSFVSNIASNPSSGIFGQPTQKDDTLGIINNLKDREMTDFQNKANFMSDLSIKQDRLRRVYGLDKPPDNPMQDQMQNQQLGDARQKASDAGADRMRAGLEQMENPGTPTGLTAGQRGQFQIASQRLAQQGVLGDQALGIKQQQADLSQQKSDSIHDQKMRDSQDKMTVAKNKLELAQQQLAAKTQAGEDTTQLHKDIAENTKAYHDATQAQERLKFERSFQQKDDQFNALRDEHQRGQDILAQRNKDAQTQTTTTVVDQNGNRKIVNKKTGAAARTVDVKGKDGQTYTIPEDQLDDWNANHAADESGDSGEDDSGGEGGGEGGGGE